MGNGGLVEGPLALGGRSTVSESEALWAMLSMSGPVNLRPSSFTTRSKSGPTHPTQG